MVNPMYTSEPTQLSVAQPAVVASPFMPTTQTILPPGWLQFTDDAGKVIFFLFLSNSKAFSSLQWIKKYIFCLL